MADILKRPMSIKQVPHSRIATVDFNNIPFGRVFSDHMVVMDYEDGEWQAPQIIPYGNLTDMTPGTSVLHYGQAIFEGMKANRDENSDDVLLFRPEENGKRLYDSAVRMGIPPVPVDVFMECLKEVVKLDRQWVPDVPESALYIRPFIYGNDPFIGVKAAQRYKFVIFTCPVGPYYPYPVKVLISEKYVRAFPGGTGAVKAAGNYAATLYPASIAKAEGYDQILWTDGLEHKYVEEIGTMNVMFQIDGKFYTPKLDGTILPGITRKSVIQLLRDAGQEVIEKKVSVEEVINAHKNGTLQDMFGVGTAATITYISDIGFRGENYSLPPIEERTISQGIKAEMEGIKRGRKEDRYNWITRV